MYTQYVRRKTILDALDFFSRFRQTIRDVLKITKKVPQVTFRLLSPLFTLRLVRMLSTHSQRCAQNCFLSRLSSPFTIPLPGPLFYLPHSLPFGSHSFGCLSL